MAIGQPSGALNPDTILRHLGCIQVALRIPCSGISVILNKHLVKDATKFLGLRKPNFDFYGYGYQSPLTLG